MSSKSPRIHYPTSLETQIPKWQESCGTCISILYIHCGLWSQDVQSLTNHVISTKGQVEAVTTMPCGRFNEGQKVSIGEFPKEVTAQIRFPQRKRTKHYLPWPSRGRPHEVGCSAIWQLTWIPWQTDFYLDRGLWRCPQSRAHLVIPVQERDCHDTIKLPFISFVNADWHGFGAWYQLSRPSDFHLRHKTERSTLKFWIQTPPINPKWITVHVSQKLKSEKYYSGWYANKVLGIYFMLRRRLRQKCRLSRFTLFETGPHCKIYSAPLGFPRQLAVQTYLEKIRRKED